METYVLGNTLWDICRDVEPELEPPEPAFFGPPGAGAGARFSMTAPEPPAPAPAPGRLKAKFSIIHERK